jgi:L-cysteine desulfidase
LQVLRCIARSLANFLIQTNHANALGVLAQISDMLCDGAKFALGVAYKIVSHVYSPWLTA